MATGPQDDFSAEESIPQGAASLESILCTDELRRRPYRPPDYEKENRALVALATAMVDPKSNILQTFAETILEITQSDSAGLSLLTKDGGNRFYWPAIAGEWKPHAGAGTPRNFGPAGDVLDRDCTLLFRRFERRYTHLRAVAPAAEECLMVPFYVAGKAVGTIWAIMHSDRRGFDAEDERVLTALVRQTDLDAIVEEAMARDGEDRRLGLPRTTLVYKMRKLGIEARRSHRSLSIHPADDGLATERVDAVGSF